MSEFGYESGQCCESYDVGVDTYAADPVQSPIDVGEPAVEYAPAPVEEYAAPAPVEEYAPVEPVAPAPVEEYTPAPVQEYAAPAVDSSAHGSNVSADAVGQPRAQAPTGPVDLIDAINAQNSSAAQGQSLVISAGPMSAGEPAGLAEVTNASSASTGVSISSSGLVIGPDPSPGVPLVTNNVDPLNTALSHNAISSGAGFVMTPAPNAGYTGQSLPNVSERWYGGGYWYGRPA